MHQRSILNLGKGDYFRSFLITIEASNLFLRQRSLAKNDLSLKSNLHAKLSLSNSTIHTVDSFIDQEKSWAVEATFKFTRITVTD